MSKAVKRDESNKDSVPFPSIRREISKSRVHFFSFISHFDRNNNWCVKCMQLEHNNQKLVAYVNYQLVRMNRNPNRALSIANLQCVENLALF